MSLKVFDFLFVSCALIALYAFFALHSCSTAPVAPPAPAPAPAVGWKWNALVASRLTPAMREADFGDLCPKPGGFPREQIWQALVYATVQAESGGDPTVDFKERFSDSAGNQQVSSGLLQLSIDDRWRGGACKGLSAATIHDEATNLSCGLEIMRQILGTRPTLRASLGRYWSSIRDKKIDATLRRLVPGCF